jgi:hypothetical protein
MNFYQRVGAFSGIDIEVVMIVRILFGFWLVAMAAIGVRADSDLTPSSEGDDTVAIEQAIEKGGRIYFHSGTYRVKKSLMIDLAKVGPISFISDGTARIEMKGEGPALHFIGSHAGTADPSTVAEKVWEKERMPVVRGIEFTASNPQADAISAEGTMQLTLTQLLIREMRHGIHLLKRNRNISIDQVHIYNNRGIGIFYDQVNLHQSNITGSHISYNQLGGVVIAGGDVRNVHITGCDLEANMSEEGKYRANIWVENVQGSGAEIAVTGCTVQHTAGVTDSANIVFVGSETDTTEESPRWGHLTIADNILTDAQKNVWLKNARGVTITGNTFGEGHQQHVLVEKSESIVLGENVFDRNPPYYKTKAKDSQDVLLFRECRDCVLQGLLINGVSAENGAIQMERCLGMNLQGCSILNHGAIGLSLRGCEDCLISGCMFRSRRGENGVSVLEIGSVDAIEMVGNKTVKVERRK